ncbi:Protein neuralized [Fragariocoptes setiger]|uniref:Protein neuralized n=1 Tax=Fragariocoptes setiger TaxID=1670756 RepID=A0ABQ7SD22_9ACAR|nr:Protein neuralized [Fragariocoptes setiger]
MGLMKKAAHQLARKLAKLLCLDKLGTQAKENQVLAAANSRLPAVQFHHVHGDNVQLSNNNFVATRSEGFCQGVVFSNRTIMPNERVYIKLVGVSTLWSGTIRFGFTSEDPASLVNSLPKFVCPDMTATGKTWAKAIDDPVARKNYVIHFSYTNTGSINYGINNQDCGSFPANISKNQKLWFVIDIYGNTTSIELLDPRQLSTALPLTVPMQCTHPVVLVGTGNTPVKNRHNLSAANGTYAAPPMTSPYKPMPMYHPHHHHYTTQAQVPPSGTAHNNSELPPVTPCSTATNTTTTQSTGNIRTRRLARRHALFSSASTRDNRLATREVMTPLISQQNIYSPSPMAPHNSTVMQCSTNCNNANTKDTSSTKTSGVKSTKNSIYSHSNSNGKTTTTTASCGAKSQQSRLTTNNNKSSVKEINSSNNNKSNNSKKNATRDCLICFERPINCVLYQCGHMCTCYQCGVKQWRSQSRTCPICRTVIKDVIKTYMA